MKTENEEMNSLNNDLFDDLYLEKLEERLETDPFMLNGLWNEAPDMQSTGCFCDPICEGFDCGIY